MNHLQFLTRKIPVRALILAAGGFLGLESAPGVPSLAPRSYHTAVWSGSEMILWGGAGQSSLLDDGRRYDPSANSWQTIATSVAPAARSSHSAVWTGSEMIAWGGDSGIAYLNDGARYNPANDTWTLVNPASAPVARYTHTAVWAGNKMIVWGGYNGSYLNSGGRYNPAANTWASTTTASAPTARRYHTAVWTGSEMIIWGGYSGSYLSDGKRYNPVADSWSPVNASGTPAARRYHTAVWTGSQMIIWGGATSGGVYLGDGARYNSPADTWSTMTVAGAPSHRIFHTAVWTGTEMIIWGGYNGSSWVNDGGRYNPAANTWTAVATVGAPSPRYVHTAVWTGTEMIVWGGYDGNNFVNDGARYNPVSNTWTPLPASFVCPPGFPDDFECREILSGTNVYFSATNVGATTEPGEPSHFNGGLGPVPNLAAGASLWYSWTAPFSGGVVVTANSSFKAPSLAAYTGNNLASLTRVASNNTLNAECRLVFNALAGTNYQIALDGTTNYSTISSAQGNADLQLTLTPPPANNAFTNRTPVTGTFYETAASLIGATREPGEPAHTNNGDFYSSPHTVWWTWTAPANLGVSGLQVKLIAQGVDFQPNLGIYTGNSLANLTNVFQSVQALWNTRLVDFTAVTGAVYQIAMGGLQEYPTLASPRLANYYLRLNVRALVLAFAGVNSTNNPDHSVSFGADFQVINFGSAASSALRVKVLATSGVSFYQDTGFAPEDQILLLTTNLPALNPGQGVVRRINGVVPPPDTASTNDVTYAAYAELQEQVGTNWITLDQTLVLFGVQSTSIGVGGGIIRVDPGVTGAAFNPLTNVSVLGPVTVSEGSAAAYLGRARYANGFQYDFTNTLWTTTMFSITNGLLTTGSVGSNSPATVAAKYSSGGFTYNAPTNVTILNLPPPAWAGSFNLSNKQFQATLTGVPGRKHVIEAATNLTGAANWIPLTTNVTATNGSWLFQDPGSTNHPRRFYRARETQ